MTIDKSYYSFIKPTQEVKTCNYCCHKQPQQNPNLGIFGFGYPAQTTPIMNFGFNPFGGFLNYNFPQFNFNLFSGLNFDISNLWKPFNSIGLNSIPAISSIPTTFLPAPISTNLVNPPKSNNNDDSKTKEEVSPRNDWSCVGATNKTKEEMKKEVGKNDNNFEAQLKAKNVTYNAELGHNIAKTAITSVTGGTGQCAHYVNNALEANGIDPQRDNHAYTRAHVLRNNTENFTEIKITKQEELNMLPAGSIVVYQKGVCGYSKEHGHTFTATGSGGGGSDHFQKSFRFPEDGKGISVFVPTTKIA